VTGHDPRTAASRTLRTAPCLSGDWERTAGASQGHDTHGWRCVTLFWLQYEAAQAGCIMPTRIWWPVTSVETSSEAIARTSRQQPPAFKYQDTQTHKQ
jgi:hypothetical protein